jgi:stearoyl-CoA desaturase (delta-9 desaturase)
MHANPPESSPNNPVDRYMEPVERFPVWSGKHLGLDLINVLTLGTVLVPTAGLVLLAVLYWGQGVGWFELGLFVVTGYLAGIGVTLGYHRYFTHGSFETHPFMVRLLGVLAAVNMQGPILFWCASHRAHHQHSDREGDPHSPHLSGDGIWGWLKGFFHAHLGWIVVTGNYRYNPRLVRDLHQNPDVRWVDHYYFLWIFLGLAVPALLGGLYHGSWQGAVIGLFWGGLARIAFIHHLTWSVNSFGHIFGDKPFRTHDESRNSFFLALISLGDGWHNNHHAFPRSARHGLYGWQVDFTYVLIQLMERMGLVWNVRRVDEKTISAKHASS